MTPSRRRTRSVGEPPAERRDRAGGLHPWIAADGTLVAGHARHGERAGRGRGLGHRVGLLVGPAAGAIQADLHQHREPAPGRPGGEDPVQDGHAVGAVDVAVHRKAGVGGELVRQPGDTRLVHQLVGQQQPGEAEGPVGPQLANAGHGDAPGTAGQLAGGELGRHGGLAVRRQLHPGLGAVGGHRRQVARQRRLAQREHRVAEPGRVHRWPGPGELSRGRPGRQQAQALVGRLSRAFAQRRQALRDQRRQRMRHLAS